jgi:hypothetical protein
MLFLQLQKVPFWKEFEERKAAKQIMQWQHGGNGLYNQDKQLDLFQHLLAYC